MRKNKSSAKPATLPLFALDKTSKASIIRNRKSAADERLALRCRFSAPYEGTFLGYENIPQSSTERGMTLMKLELNFSDLCQLALVIIALIELFRKREHKKK